jgi:hypothetical protein
MFIKFCFGCLLEKPLNTCAKFTLIITYVRVQLDNDSAKSAQMLVFNSIHTESFKNFECQSTIKNLNFIRRDSKIINGNRGKVSKKRKLIYFRLLI